MRRKLVMTLLLLGPIACVGLLDCFSATSAAEQPQPVKQEPAKKAALQKFMRAKLALAQGLLEGLAVEDFAKLDKNAKALLLLTTAEEWSVSKNSLYLQHSDEFRRAIKQLNKNAEAKNLDGASYSFVQLTMSCVECHRFVRNELIADKDK